MSSSPRRSSAVPQIHASGSAVSTPSENLYLEIGRGKTSFPKRPITGDRYLIGSGDWCDLCLGGKQMPTLHSVIHRDGEQLWIDAVNASPELRINGQLATFAELTDGDCIEIGSFELTIHFSNLKSSGAASTGPYRVVSAADACEIDEEQKLEDMSAAELVDLIEAEMEMVEEFDRRKKRGAEALMDAIQRHQPAAPVTVATPKKAARPAVAAQAPTAQPLELLKELEAAISSLNRFAHNLERRSAKMSRHEVQGATASLLEIQDVIVDRLDEVLSKISAAQPTQTPGRHRDVA